MRERSSPPKTRITFGMVELFADAGLALEAVEEDRIGLHIGVRNLQRHLAVVAHVGGAIDGGHAAAGNRLFNAVEIDLRSRLQSRREIPSGGTLQL